MELNKNKREINSIGNSNEIQNKQTVYESQLTSEIQASYNVFGTQEVKKKKEFGTNVKYNTRKPNTIWNSNKIPENQTLFGTQVKCKSSKQHSELRLK